MTVAVEKGLDGIKNTLLKKGYTVIYAKSNVFADAYIFSGSRNNGILSADNCLFQGQNGVLMINAQGKTADDIDRILKSRLYSPLFKI